MTLAHSVHLKVRKALMSMLKQLFRSMKNILLWLRMEPVVVSSLDCVAGRALTPKL